MRWLVAVICVGCSGGETKSADPPTVAKPQLKAEAPAEDPRVAKAVHDIEAYRNDLDATRKATAALDAAARTSDDAVKGAKTDADRASAKQQLDAASAEHARLSAAIAAHVADERVRELIQ